MYTNRPDLYDCNSCLFKLITCQYVTQDEFEIIRQASVPIRFKKGETIFKQGTRSTHLAFLHRGIVKFIYLDESERPFITAIVKGTKLLGAANFFFRETNLFTLVAVEDCDICLIDHRLLRNLAIKHGNLMLSMAERTVEMFQSSILNFISLANKQVNGRIADILIYLWEYVYKDGEYPFELTRKEIAEFAACSYENVIITLSRFNKEGIITLDGRKIIINDLERLNVISKRG